MADIEFNIDIQNTQNINANFTNSLNINLQKELTMGIELNSPLYIGADTNLQKQVAQNTADITELKSDVAEIGDLDNLTTTDKFSLVGAINEVNTLLPPTSQRDYIDNSKGMPTGAVSSNALILPEIQNYAHSTFDLSKFTVVGSPTITDDGIASEFSGSNYLTIGTQSAFASDNWELYLPFKLNSLTPPTGTQQVIFGGASLSSGYAGFRVLVENTDKITLNLSEDGQNWRVFGLSTGLTVEANKNYIAYFKRENDSIIPKLSEDGGKTWTTGTPYSINYSLYGSTTYGLGSSTSGTSWIDGSIDLKQFSITVDGVEVFSGNRTGIDTIKPDDYTVVGTPTISADGVVSGFSATSVIQPNYDFNNASTANSWEVYIKLKTGSSVSDNQNFFANTSANYTNLRLLNGKLRMEIGGGSSFLFSLTGITTLQANTVYYVKFVFAGTKYQIWLSTDGITYTLDNEGNSTDKFVSQGTWCIGSSYNMSQYAFPFLGTIDLNEFKIYVDGNLVYQPCLKIPYTWSKTGSKIVASIYRDRVNDMASQFGFAPYYTLSDTDFTLPQVELYGLIGAKTLRDSYENGINKWYLYSNRDLEQQGSCTSGVEVTLPKPFADTNYILTVPYSAKSATAFTPTQTGDWYAKGKGIL